jgi:hypothetical protein
MHRHVLLMPVTLVIALAGCQEYGFGEGLPEWPDSIPPTPEEVQQVDAIMQVQTPRVDILWTVDNSCSMGDNQADLVANFPLFMDYFLGSGLDYHIGVTSTDIDGNYNGSKGKLVNVMGLKYIDPDTGSPIEIFSEMATLGTSGSGTEKGLGGTYQCLEMNRDTLNAGFYRDESALHTIIISDEPDLTQSQVITVEEFKNWYDGLKPEAAKRTFSSIIDYNAGGDYRNVSNDIGGIVWDINGDDWPQLLVQLGVQAAGLKREYFLSHLPVSSSIEVTVDDVGGASLNFDEAPIDPATGEVGEGDWYYTADRNSITFVEYIPNSLSTVVLEYTLLAAQHGDIIVEEAD